MVIVVGVEIEVGNTVKTEIDIQISNKITIWSGIGWEEMEDTRGSRVNIFVLHDKRLSFHVGDGGAGVTPERRGGGAGPSALNNACRPVSAARGSRLGDRDHLYPV
ncbi:hypothetical protein EVAR_57089_1 [Eumeta japonica]|uniref:Uncharacterized protein n=1 Tax=Eumeta variegata TaxID=151549 RepID=A0A4C1Z9W6_EUMVA|nr:hypothetical protein EVAR_57089_1 [Eumeta japonica]